jgi:hypothetical protein
MKKTIALALVLGLALSAAAQAGVILIVTDDGYKNSRSGPGTDADFASFLTGLGHTVHTSTPGQYKEGNEGSAGAASFAAANMVDLIIVSRDTNSGAYDEGNNGAGWNAIDVPLILMGPHISRSSRWKWLDTTSATTQLVEDIKIVEPGDPFVAGLTESYTSGGYVTYNGTPDGGNGTVIATTQDDNMLLVRWDAGTEFYAGSGQTAGATRVLLGGIPYHEDHGGGPMTFGHYTDNGKDIIAQVVYNTIPEPMTIALLGFGGLALIRKKR